MISYRIASDVREYNGIDADCQVVKTIIYPGLTKGFFVYYTDFAELNTIIGESAIAIAGLRKMSGALGFFGNRAFFLKSLEELMILATEHITANHRFWSEVNSLAKEAFPPEEYLAPSTLVEMANADNFDFLVLMDHGSFVGYMAVQTYQNLAYLFFLAINSICRSKG